MVMDDIMTLAWTCVSLSGYLAIERSGGIVAVKLFNFIIILLEPDQYVLGYAGLERWTAEATDKTAAFYVASETCNNQSSSLQMQ